MPHTCPQALYALPWGKGENRQAQQAEISVTIFTENRGLMLAVPSWGALASIP